MLYVSIFGEVWTWTNARSCLPGTNGDGLNVAWRQGFHLVSTSFSLLYLAYMNAYLNQGQSTGMTHYGMRDLLTPEDRSDIRKRIHFARVFGQPQDFGLLGKQDYVYIQHTNTTSGRHRFDVRVWKNTGSGGTKLEGMSKFRA